MGNSILNIRIGRYHFKILKGKTISLNAIFSLGLLEVSKNPHYEKDWSLINIYINSQEVI